MDSFGRFDLLALNALDIPQIVRSSRSWDRGVARGVQQKAESLLSRVVEDTEQSPDIARLLHELVRISYKSGLDAANASAWSERAAASWSGLFFESRDPGGRRVARLADRLTWAARGESEPPPPGAIARHLKRTSRAEGSPSLAGATEEKVVILETVQALVDDLVERPLIAGSELPLPRLSELGQERGPRELNAVFSLLFPPDADGAFVVADPRRYPGEPRIALHRPGDSGVSGPGMFWISVEPAASEGSPGPAGATSGPRRDPARMWDDTAITPQEWGTVLAALQAAGTRLGAPPPGDYRHLSGYIALRRWLLDDPTAGPIFDAVRWKDRPLGLLLLGRLVLQHTWVPKASTDAEYLEAELNDLVTGDPEKTPPERVWAVRSGWNVRVDASSPESPKYVLEAAPKT